MENQQKPPTRGQPRTLEVHNKEITKNNKNAQQRNDEQHHKHTTKK
jgi:hypothetical protein